MTTTNDRSTRGARIRRWLAAGLLALAPLSLSIRAGAQDGAAADPLEAWGPFLGNWEIEYEDGDLGRVRGHATVALLPLGSNERVGITGAFHDGAKERRFHPIHEPRLREEALLVDAYYHEGVRIRLVLGQDGEKLEGRWTTAPGYNGPRVRTPAGEGGGREIWRRARPSITRVEASVRKDGWDLGRLPAELDAKGLVHAYVEYSMQAAPAHLPVVYVDVFGTGPGLDGRNDGGYPIYPTVSIQALDPGIRFQSGHGVFPDRLRLAAWLYPGVQPGRKRFLLDGVPFEFELKLPGVAPLELARPEVLEIVTRSAGDRPLADGLGLRHGDPFLLRARFASAPGQDVVVAHGLWSTGPGGSSGERQLSLVRTDDPLVFESATLSLCDPDSAEAQGPGPAAFAVPRRALFGVELAGARAAAPVEGEARVQSVAFLVVLDNQVKEISVLVAGRPTVAEVEFDGDVEHDVVRVTLDTGTPEGELTLEAVRVAPGSRRFRTAPFRPTRSGEGLGAPPVPKKIGQ